MNLNLEFNFKKKDKPLAKDNYQINADKYWRIILYIASILVAFSLVYGVFLFRKTSEQLDIRPKINPENSVVLKKDKLDQVLSVFSERKKKSIEIINYSTGVVDPSI